MQKCARCATAQDAWAINRGIPIPALKSPTIPIGRDINAVGDDPLMTDND